MENSRTATFSSSAISALVKLGSRPMTEDEMKEYKKENPKGKKKNINAGFGQAGLTYIQEKIYEKKLGKALTSEISAKATSWGTFLESRVFELLNLSYSLDSKKRLGHTTIKEWTGAPDTIRGEFVGDIKCPWTLKSFCEGVEAASKGWEEFKEVKPEWAWQLVSNGILTGKDKAEIIIYVPYLSELEDIREMANMFDGDQKKIAFINWAGDNELPHLLDEGEYKNLNIFEFDIPKEDKEFLTERVDEAVKLLNA